MLFRIHLPYLTLQSKVNEQLESFIQSPQLSELQSLFTEVSIKAEEGIRFSGEGDRLQSQLVLSGIVGIRKGTIPFAQAFGNLDRIQFGIRVFMHTYLQISPEWDILATSTSEYNWTQKPVWAGGLLKTPLSGFFQPFIEKALQDVSRTVDTFIRNQITLRDSISEAWDNLLAPISIETGEPSPYFFFANPEDGSAQLTGISFEPDELSTQLYVPAAPFVYPHSHAGQIRASSLKVPDHQRALSLDHQFNDLQFHLPWTWLQSHLENLTFNESPFHLKVHDVALGSAGDAVRLQCQFAGRWRRVPIKGLLILTGKPGIQNGKIILENIVLAFPRINWIGRLLYRRGHKSWETKIIDQLHVLLNGYWENTSSFLQEEIEVIELSEEVRLTAPNACFQLINVSPNETILNCKVRIEGDLNLEIIKID